MDADELGGNTGLSRQGFRCRGGGVRSVRMSPGRSQGSAPEIDSESSRNVVAHLHRSTQRINNDILGESRPQILASEDLLIRTHPYVGRPLGLITLTATVQ
jgi:hypothetical protein